MEPRKSTLKYAVFKYLVKNEKEFKDEKKYSEINYEELNEKRDGANSISEIFDSFISDYKNQSKILNNTLKIFGIEDSNIMYVTKSHSKYQYDLNDNEVDFISELLFKLNHDYTWKKIRKIDNRNYDGFVQLYKKTDDRDKLISEIKFAVDGFLKICERKYGKESEKYENFYVQLSIFTQYSQLVWMTEMESILFNALPINTEDVYNSKMGQLLSDYQCYLNETSKLLKRFISKQNEQWNTLKEIRREEFNNVEFTDDTMNSINNFISIVKSHDQEIGEILEYELLDNEQYDYKAETYKKVKSLFEKSFSELPEKDQNEILNSINNECYESDIMNEIKAKVDEFVKSLNWKK